MYAIEVAQTGGPEVLSYVERPQPSLGPGEVLIKAEAIGLNFIDTYFRSGLYPHKLPFALGTEVAGTVAAVGEAVTALQTDSEHAGERHNGHTSAGPWRLHRLAEFRTDSTSCPHTGSAARRVCRPTVAAFAAWDETDKCARGGPVMTNLTR